MTGDGGMIGTAQLSDKIKGIPGPTFPRGEGKGSLKEQVEKLEKALLIQKTREYNGNKSKTARALGLSRYGLTKKMRRYGL